MDGSHTGASVSVRVHRTRHVAYDCFWQDSVRSVLPSVVVHTTRRNGLFVNKRFVSEPRRERANNLLSLSSSSLSSSLSFVKSFNAKNGIRSKIILLMESRITTEMTISHETATWTARHRSLSILPSVFLKKVRLLSLNEEFKLAGK
jgi:hypothetical protein